MNNCLKYWHFSLKGLVVSLDDFFVFLSKTKLTCQTTREMKTDGRVTYAHWECVLKR